MSSVRVNISDATYILDSSTTSTGLEALSTTSKASVINSSFVSRNDGATDLGSATDGNYIVTTDELGFIFVYTMTGVSYNQRA